MQISFWVARYLPFWRTICDSAAWIENKIPSYLISSWDIKLIPLPKRLSSESAIPRQLISSVLPRLMLSIDTWNYLICWSSLRGAGETLKWNCSTWAGGQGRAAPQSMCERAEAVRSEDEIKRARGEECSLIWHSFGKISNHFRWPLRSDDIRCSLPVYPLFLRLTGWPTGWRQSIRTSTSVETFFVQLLTNLCVSSCGVLIED